MRSGGYLVGPGSVVGGTVYVISRDAPIRSLPPWLDRRLSDTRSVSRPLSVPRWAGGPWRLPELVATAGKADPARRLRVRAEVAQRLARHRAGETTARTRVEALAERVATLGKLAARHTAWVTDLQTRLDTARAHQARTEKEFTAV